jgi:acyl transferase domain-containing protein
MLGVTLPERSLVGRLPPELDLAAVNTTGGCVVSGPVAPIEEFARRLAADGVPVSRLPLDTAGHSRLCDPNLGAFEAVVAGADLAPPSVALVSNLTGGWLTADQATDPHYWTRQFRSTVRFADGVDLLLDNPDRVFVEVGPGRILTDLVRAHSSAPPDQVVVPSLPSHLEALAALWRAGADVDWAGFYAHERRRRVALPTYPFDGERHWYEASRPRVTDQVRAALRRMRGVFERRRPANRPAPAAARTQTEKRVAEIWREVLGTPAASADDDFFLLGGSSILATKLIARVNQAFGVELTPLTLLESPTIAGLAGCVDSVLYSAK